MRTISNLKIVIRTAHTRNAGNNDNIWLDIGKHRWKLSNRNARTCIKKENEDEFMVQIPSNLIEKDFSRVLICKDPDDEHGDLHLEGIKVFLNEKEIYNNPNINEWLEDKKNREWLAPDFIPASGPPKSLMIFENEIKNSINIQFSKLFRFGIWNKLSLKGDLLIGIECENISIMQNFDTHVSGPKPTLTLWMQLIPHLHDHKVEMKSVSEKIFADYPWWYEIASPEINELIDSHLQNGITRIIQENIQEVIQSRINETITNSHASLISLRPHKIEIMY